jgi:molybdopterin converting factor small subunit
MTVEIITHGVLKDHLERRFSLEVKTDCLIMDLAAQLAGIKPELPAILSSCRFAMNDCMVEDDARLYDGARVDVLPPFSGG